MIAMLGMYDMLQLQAANDRFWQQIRLALGYGPDHLSRDVDVWQVWRSPDLLLAQTCGLPYRSRLHGDVQLVGTPDYGLPGCPPGHYMSVFVVRADDPRDTLAAFDGGRFAYNEPLSQSGWAAPITHLTAQGIGVSALVETGGHRASALAVLEGRADLAGLDALTWALLQDHETWTSGLRVLEATRPTPGLPYITGQDRDPVAIASAVSQAIRALDPDDRGRLHLQGLVQIPAHAYLDIETPDGPWSGPA